MQALVPSSMQSPSSQLPYAECFPQSSLISQAKEKLVDQDALVSSLLTFDFESEGQSDDFGTSDGLSDIWGAVEGVKEGKACSISGDSRSTATNFQVECEGMSLLTMGSGTMPVPCPGLKRPACTASPDQDAGNSLKKAKSGCSKVDECQSHEGSWACLPARQVSASLTHSDSPQASSQTLGFCCTPPAGMASPPAKPRMATSLQLPVTSHVSPVATPGFQPPAAAHVTFQYGPPTPGPFTMGLAHAAVMHPGSPSAIGPVPATFGVALGQPHLPFPAWHLAGTPAGAAPPMLAPSMLGPAPVMPLPAFSPRLMTSSPARLPFGFGTMPMIPNPELGLACGEGGGPPSAQRVVAEFLAQPNQAPPLGLKLDTAALAAQIGAAKQLSA